VPSDGASDGASDGSEASEASAADSDASERSSVRNFTRLQGVHEPLPPIGNSVWKAMPVFFFAERVRYHPIFFF
jgi:hypothetical protein